MEVLTFFITVFATLMVKDGALSCTLRNHKPECSDSTSTSHHKPASCIGSSFDAFNTISSNAPDSFSFPQKPPVSEPHVVSLISPFDHQLIMNLLLNHLSFASLEPLQPSRPSYSTTTSLPLITTTPSPTFDHNDDAQLKQLLSILLSGSGTSIPSTPAPTIAVPPSVPAQNTMPAAVPAAAIVPIAAPSANPAEPAAVVMPADVAAPSPSVPNEVPAAPVPALQPVATPASVPAYDPADATPEPTVPATPAASAPASEPAIPPSPVPPYSTVSAVPSSAPVTFAAPESAPIPGTN